MLHRPVEAAGLSGLRRFPEKGVGVAFCNDRFQFFRFVTFEPFATKESSHPVRTISDILTGESVGFNESIAYQKYAFFTIFNSTDRWVCLITVDLAHDHGNH